MNRKGSAAIGEKYPFWLLFGFMIIIFFFAFGLLTGIYKNKLTKTPPELAVELITLRFINIPECFAFEEGEIVFPGMIDKQKFNEEQLHQCYKTDPEKGIKTFNFRLKLEGTGEELTTNNYFNHEDDKLTRFHEVLVRDGDKLHKDQLTIYVQEKIGQ